MEKEEEFATIDITKITPLQRIIAMVKRPQKPGKACMFSSGYILEHELEDIAKHLNIEKDQLQNNLLEKSYVYNKILHKPRLQRKGNLPYGRCVFLEEKNGEHQCRLKDKKPLHCRISTAESHGHKLHLWYLLNHVVDANDPEALRQWALYLKTHPTIPGGQLDELEPDAEKLKKILNYEI